MPASKKFCATQIQRLNILRDANFRLQAAYTPLYEALARYANSNEEAQRAIDMLLDDPIRAADSGRNGVPEPAELQSWVLSARGGQEGVSAVVLQPLCGKCEIGWVRTTLQARGMTYEAVRKCVCQGGSTDPSRPQMRLGLAPE